MSKKLIRLVIGVTAFALIGVIAAQAYWITNAYKVRKANFHAAVDDAMQAVTRKIEEHQTARLLMGSPFDAMNSFQPMWQPPKHYNRPGTPMNGRFRVEVNVNHNGEQTDIEVEASSDSVIMLRSDLDSMTEMVEFSLRRLQNKMAHMHSVGDALMRDLIEQEHHAFTRVDHRHIAASLERELQRKGIQLPFVVGVGDARGIGGLRADSAYARPLMKTSYRTALFPNSILNNDRELLVYFPGRDHFLLRSIGWALGGSALLVLIVLLAFISTVYIIFRQKRLSEMKSDFINNMTHELKTPIATIGLASEAIGVQAAGGAQTIGKYASIIREENQRMNRHVETILQMARMDRENYEIKSERIPIGEIAEDAVAKIKLQVENRNGTVHFQSSVNGAVVMGDRLHLTNVIYNILDNANKYSPDQPDIALEAFEDKGMVTLRIRDKGIGMSREQRKRIFETFFRVTTGNLHDVKGFGLGLSYVKAVVERHGGTVEVESEPGAGSVFTVRLPLAESESL